MILSKIHISVMLLGPMLAGAGTAGVAWATLGGRVTAIESAHAELKPRVSIVEGAVQDLKIDTAVLKTQTKAIEDGIDRLEDKMGTRK